MNYIFLLYNNMMKSIFLKIFTITTLLLSINAQPEPVYTTGHLTSAPDPTYISYYPNANNPSAPFYGYRLGHPDVNDFTDYSLFGQDVAGLMVVWGQPGATGDSSNYNSWWSFVCSLDPDGDGFTNAQEMGADCSWTPGTPVRENSPPYISNPNHGGLTPIAGTPTTTTTSTTTTPTSTSTTTSTSTSATTSTSTSSTTSSTSSTTSTSTVTNTTTNMTINTTTNIPTNLATNISTMNKTWYKYCITYNLLESCFTVYGTALFAGGDPHYLLHNNEIVTCDKLGWNLLAKSHNAILMVYHFPIGSTQATAITSISITYTQTNRTIIFDSKPNYGHSDEYILMNDNSATDIKGENYIEIQRVQTDFGVFLNVQVLFTNVIDGIMKNGCERSNYIVNDYEICKNIKDRLAKFACNADITRIGSDAFVNMAKSSEQQRQSLSIVDLPNETNTIITKKIQNNVQQSPTIYIIIALICVVLLGIVGVIVFLVLKFNKNNTQIHKDEKKYIQYNQEIPVKKVKYNTYETLYLLMSFIFKTTIKIIYFFIL
jgi:hypothetical protein